MERNKTLAEAFFGDTALWRKAVLVLGASVLIAIAAQISIRLGPVPMTLQTLAILFVGFTLGARLGVAALLAYLAEGAMGLPVFANGGAGLAYMAGPTGGFLLGFVAMAWIAGTASDRGWTRHWAPASIAALFASAAIYLPGLVWPAAVMGTAWADLWAFYMAPFLLGDAIKAVLAALIVTGAWKLADRRA